LTASDAARCPPLKVLALHCRSRARERKLPAKLKEEEEPTHTQLSHSGQHRDNSARNAASTAASDAVRKDHHDAGVAFMDSICEKTRAHTHDYRTARQDEEFLHGEDSGEDAALEDLLHPSDPCLDPHFPPGDT
jgi:hypothetical protein